MTANEVEGRDGERPTVGQRRVQLFRRIVRLPPVVKSVAPSLSEGVTRSFTAPVRRPLEGPGRWVRQRHARAAQIASLIQKQPTEMQNRGSQAIEECTRGKVLYRLYEVPGEGTLVVPGPQTRTYDRRHGWRPAWPWFAGDHAAPVLHCRCCNTRQSRRRR